MSGFKFTGLGSGSAPTDSATLGQIQNQSTTYCGTSGGTANAQTLTPTPVISAYAAGQRFSFLPVATNTSGTVTIANSGLTARNAKKGIGGAKVILAIGDLIIGVPAEVIDDGTDYVLLNPQTYSHGADVASATTTVLDTTTGDLVDITGTTAITAITLSEGREVTVRFTGILTLTNGASLVLPGAANITTAVGDFAVFRGYASGVVRAIFYTRASGQPLNVSSIANTPQGRLTLTSSTPIMASDTTATSSVYYTPYIGTQIPIYNGTSFINNVFAQLTMTLNASNNTSTNLYDLFVFLNTGVVTIASGPAWTNSTTRSAALTQLNGLWVNNATITLTNGATSYASITANQATYVGTVYCTANAQTGMQFRPAAAAGGSAAILGLYNAYSREMTYSSSEDSTSSYTYATATWRSANNNVANRISYIDGLAQSPVAAEFQIGSEPTTNATPPFIGINLNSTSATPRATAGGGLQNTACNMLMTSDNFAPTLGFNFIQAMEFASSGATSTLYPKFQSQQIQRLGIKIAM